MFLEKYTKLNKFVYGVNSGYGGSADVRNTDAIENQKSLILFLNCGISNRVMNPGLVRASMLVRANSLSNARSGVRPEVVQLLCDMINNNIVPVVPLRGSISASGDLMPLSYIAACMSGMKADSPVYFNGSTSASAKTVFDRCNLSFITFMAKEALAVINSSSCAATLAAVNLFDFGSLILLSELVSAMSVEVLHGRMESFHPIVHENLQHFGVKEFLEAINKLLRGSQFVRSNKIYDISNTNCGLAQDRYPLRTSPQWFSPLIETLSESIRKINVEINSTNDNPIIDHINEKVIHCGNFQVSNTAVAMDQTRQSVQMCAKMIFAQLSEILNFHMTDGLTPNLSGCDYTNDFGFKGVDIALASYVSEIQTLNSPVTNQVLSAEMHNQAINSLALISSRMTAESIELLKMILSSSIICLCQALDLRWLQKKVNESLKISLSRMSFPVSKS
ncbi:hypothetical protein HELRODRAFT_78007 [Helobdella robusta]|uniref:Phenylalanine ammonia-lyase n=1 Tax=Helobdella robusta TaxID=6412 RepID=T1G366_HELRO|nr:hypothetical protein HELRODRAFT_78007 [Helobdella robusta]ESO05420.1 hypothetical protein HELRODRAFT_78007 [Helobdella robusta]